MQLSAILHIPLSRDAYALEEDTVTIRLKTAKNDIKSVFLYYGDRVCMQENVVTTEVVMEKIAQDSMFDYYEVTFLSPYTRICYYFYIEGIDQTGIFYSEDGFTKQMQLHRTRYFQFPYIHRADIIKPPGWAKDIVMYHIFPDSFASEKRSLKQTGEKHVLEKGLFSESRLGGNLSGIIENLDYITELGINCLYLNPIFKAESYHKYDTIDYYEIDPCFGTKSDLKRLVKECHKRGVRVILDGVFNHCGSGFFAFLDVIEKEEDSKYKDWFYDLKFPVCYDTPPNYEAFAYVKEMPKLNTANKDVETYFCNVGAYWLQEADIDGWRLDVANEINHDFWRAFKKAVRDVKKDAFLIGEIWEESSVWLLGDQFDSTMNYTFTAICKEFFAQKITNIKTFDEKVNHMILRYPKRVSEAQMNFLDTHDVARFFGFCKNDVKAMEFAVIFMMTCVGIPSVFYGDELLLQGDTEEEYRKAMPWDAIRQIRNEDKSENEKNQLDYMLSFYKKWIQIRKEHTVLKEGSYKTICADDRNQIYVYKRYYNEILENTSDSIGEKTHQTNQTIVVIMNFSIEERRVILEEEIKDVWVDLETNKENKSKEVACPAKGVRICLC